MSTWKIIISVVYFLGIFLVKYTDSIIPDDLRDKTNHTFILFLMWLFSPLVMIGFVLYILYLLIFNIHGKKE